MFKSDLFDYGDQLELTLELFQSWGVGVLIYLRQDGCVIDLLNEIKAYEPHIMKYLKISSVKLLTNNPSEMLSMENSEVDVINRVSAETDFKPKSMVYMQTDLDRMERMLSQEIWDFCARPRSQSKIIGKFLRHGEMTVLSTIKL